MSTGQPPAGPLRVGVTGHRDLADETIVAADVDLVLDRVAAPHQPVTLLSSLAEGADRLVAERVLARSGGTLVAILPLPIDDYARDFATETSRAQFTGLLARSARVDVVDLPVGASRVQAYERAGHEVVAGCSVLLALWDGRAARGRGGSAEIVDYAHLHGVTVEVVPVRRRRRS